MLPDAAIAGRYAAVLPALSGVEQREVLEGVRRLCALLSESAEPGAALAGMRARLAALPDAGGSGLAGDGRKRKSRSRSPASSGRAETDAAAWVSGPPPIAAENPDREKTDEDGADVEPEPPDQGALF